MESYFRKMLSACKVKNAGIDLKNFRNKFSPNLTEIHEKRSLSKMGVLLE
jgi:hypothetical protein